ncbi:Aste57867_18602 [Aphanomyces stellatus]|uniref:Aste57867_18602 protein n=1 Tax=Aphanomyces stellatus TaxID=120398 RepID=A0A485LC12_9STRA|nr:hypothetical protein As57867_018540 [Aphanomyces stellatus]VFT95337.1 Aste57867_18602 [Aphanomyces stellatus]
MSQSIRNNARPKIRTQPLTASVRSVNALTKGSGVSERSSSRGVASTSADRSPPRQPSSRRSSVSRLPMEYTSPYANPTPVGLRKRAQSESVSDDLLLQVSMQSKSSALEQDVTALEEQVAKLQSELVSSKVDLAMRDFEIMGLQADGALLRKQQLVSDAATGVLRDSHAMALQKIAEQESVMRQQARDLDDCKAWILSHYTVGSGPPRPSGVRHHAEPILHELEALEGKACVSQSVWSTGFQSSHLQRQVSVKQQKWTAQLDAMQNHVAQCVETHKAQVAELLKMEKALADEQKGGDDNVMLATRPIVRPKDASDLAKSVLFDEIVVGLTAMVDLYAQAS